MSRRLPALTAAAGAVLLLAGALSACATVTPGSSPEPPDDQTTAPVTPIDADFELAWLDGGRAIGVVTMGSSTCVPFAEAATLTAAGTVEIAMTEPPSDQACTRDLVPRVSFAALPEGIDPRQELEVVLTGDYRGDESIDGLEGAIPEPAEYEPSAGWADDGVIVLLSWGSSSCAPIVENVEVTGANEATVTFTDPPADQVCTADMAPRATVVALGEDALSDDADAQLVLAGDTFDNVTVSVLR